MSLFNSKEPEKNAKPQPVPSPQAQPVHSAPVPSPTAAAVEPKPNTNGVAAKPSAMPMSSNNSGAYLDAGSKISGKLNFETPARIDGHVDGEINAKDSLTIGESAVVAAQIKADSVIVAGKVSGDITAVHRIEIRPSAKVLGNITAPTLVINEGALFEGHCAMQAEAHDDRKVTVFPKEERLAQAAGQKPA
jgi:cytoskeletal protein CcmA (bactofilin family)